MGLLKLFLALLVLALGVQAEKYKKYTADDWMIYVCGTVLTTFATWCEGQVDYDYTCYCYDDNARASLAGCFAFNTDHPNGRYETFIKTCSEFNYTVTIEDMEESLQLYSAKAQSVVASSTEAASETSAYADYSSAAANSTATDAASMSEASASSSESASSEDAETYAPTVPMVDYPILVDTTTFTMYWDAYSQFYQNYSGSFYYASGIYAYWALVLLGATISNWAVVMFPGIRLYCNGRISKMWRKYVTLPALFRRKKLHYQKCLFFFDFLIPSRLESLIASGFFWVTFLVCAIEYPWTQDNIWYPRRYEAMIRYVADRTGIVATVILPLLFLFGGRNNFLQWITGWNFATFIMYHRWMGRVIVSLIFVHGIAYTVMYINDGYYAEEMGEEYLRYGVVATTAGALMCFQGLLFLRRRFYEVFLVIHILLAVCWVLGAWKHLIDTVFLTFMYPTVAVWCLDRLVRVARLFWFGSPKATVTLLADDCLRVVVPRPAHWKGVPGGHAWVHFLTSWYFWQSHPFTFLESVEENNQIVFLLKSKKGATYYLTKRLANLPGKTCTVRVSVEGPYGEACPVEHHDNVVFVAGGNGIPGIFSEVYSLAKRSASNMQQHLKLIWILRDPLTLEWMWRELIALRETKIQTTIYITRPDAITENLLEKMVTKESSKEEGSSGEEKDLLKKDDNVLDMLRAYFPHINFVQGRPLMDTLVQEEAEFATKSAAFITCGHPIMVDDLRYAVVLNIDKSDKRLDFYEQLQVWA